MLKLIEVEVAARDRDNATPVAMCGLCGRAKYQWSNPLRIVDADGSGDIWCPWCAGADFENLADVERLVRTYARVPGAFGLCCRLDELIRTQRQRIEQKAATEKWEREHPEEVAERRRMAEQLQAKEDARRADWIAHADEYRREDEIERAMRKAMPNLMKIGPA